MCRPSGETVTPLSRMVSSDIWTGADPSPVIDQRFCLPVALERYTTLPSGVHPTSRTAPVDGARDNAIENQLWVLSLVTPIAIGGFHDKVVRAGDRFGVRQHRVAIAAEVA